MVRMEKCRPFLWAIILLLLVFAAGCGASAGAPAKEESAENPVMLRMAEPMPKDHPTARAAALFAQLVEERSGGQIRIKIYYNSELGNPGELLEQMEFGGIALAGVSALDLTELNISLRKQFTPGTFTDTGQQMEWVREHQEMLADMCASGNVMPLVWYYPDYRCFYSSRTDITTAASLRGLKVQTAPCKLMTDLMKQWQAESIGLTSLDPYKFFNSGNIDCAESSFGEFICCNYVDYSRYVTTNNDLFFPDVLLINTESLGALSEEYQELIRVCAEATYEYQKSQMEELYLRWELELAENPGILLKEGDFR